MKKLAIAGASLALAAMPVAGVFAAELNTTLTDTLSIKVEDACQLAYGSTAHTNGTTHGTWTNNTLSATLANGTTNEAIGSSSFNVICNYQSGWHVTATPESLEGAGSNRAITNATANADGSVYHYTPAKADSTDTTFNVGATDAGNVAVMTAATDTNGKNFNISYTVTIGATQAADTYEGDIVYTLIKGPAA